MGDEILQRHYVSLSQALLYPVDITQLLYNVKCISEKTLDEVETLETPTEDKKSILLKSLRIAVTFDYKKLKLLSYVLIKFEETKCIAERLIAEYELSFPNDKDPVTIKLELSSKTTAGDILRVHYGVLSQHMCHPVSIGQMLYGERIIDEVTLNITESMCYSHSEKRTVLLKSLRNAVSMNHKILEMFAGMLQRHTENVPVANAIMNDYRKVFEDDEKDIDELHEEANKDYQPQDDSTQGSAKNLIPRSLRPTFSLARTKFGIMFSNVRTLINPIPLDELKSFVEDCHPHLSPKLAHAATINDTLRIVRDRSTLVDITDLEAIIDRFNIKDAQPHITSYKEYIEDFCKSVSVRLCLDQTFQIPRSPSPLECEKVVFVLDWDPDQCTMEDIKDMISKGFEALARRVQVVLLKEGSSIIVTCVFPLHLTSVLVAKAQSNLELLKNTGLIKLSIGYITLWDKRNIDEEVSRLETELSTLKETVSKMPDKDDEEEDSEEEVDEELQQATLECKRLEEELNKKQTIENELKEKLDFTNRLSRKMSIEIDVLKSALRRSSSVRDIEETILEGDEKEIELKDASVQVNILQLNHRKIFVELHKESSDQNLGFIIAGGKDSEKEQSIFISKLTPGGLAEKDNQLRPGDCLVSINGIDLTNATKAEATSVLASAGDVCHIVVNREVITSVANNGTSLSYTDSIRRRSKSFKYRPMLPGVSLDFNPCSPLPECLSGGQAIAYKNKIIVGGQYSSNSANIYEYDPETDSWTTLAKTPGIWFFGLTVFQDKITVVGGFNSNTQICTANLYALNNRDKSWVTSLPRMPTARMNPSAVSLDTNIVVAGGQNNYCILNCVEVFSFITQQWYTAHPLTLEQSSMSSVFHDGYWYLLGGERQGFATQRSVRTQLQSLIDSALRKRGSVSSFKAIRSVSNTCVAVALLGGMVVTFGGEHGQGCQASDKVYVFCEDPSSWVEVGNLPIPLSNSCAVSLSDKEAMVIGGRDKSGKDCDVVYRIALQEKSYGIN